MLSREARDGYLSECRGEAIRHIEGLLSADDRRHPAYRAVLDYPLREAKGLRPALAIAACRALGGGMAEIVPTAAVFELLHNAFLVHDDIEDGSELRRHEPTLAAIFGTPIAVHTGDTMLSMALGPLLDNMRLLDLGRALRILELVSTIMRRTVEGQALELTWIAEHHWDITPAQYVEMVTLKTAWYTFAGPLTAGAIVAEAAQPVIDDLTQLGLDLGVAFQIRDDVLNLAADATVMGKESWGDLWEGKRTLVLALWLARASTDDAAFARALLARARPSALQASAEDARVARALTLVDERTLSPAARDAVRAAFRDARARDGKTAADVERLRGLIDPAIERASAVAAEYAARARAGWSAASARMAPSVHVELIDSLVEFVVARGR